MIRLVSWNSYNKTRFFWGGNKKRIARSFIDVNIYIGWSTNFGLILQN